jgi:hypothetical protein
MTEEAVATIPESYLEHRAEFSSPIFDTWSIPNPLVSSLYETLRRWDVGLGDISWNKDASTYKDFLITINVLKLRASIRFSMDAATFVALNPDWSQAEGLIELFEAAMVDIMQTTRKELSYQETALAMHVTPGQKPYLEIMSDLVNSKVLGQAQMYGISAYRGDSSLIIDKSVRYPASVFIRLQRRHGASVSFAEIAKVLYEDEVKALELLGLRNLI